MFLNTVIEVTRKCNLQCKHCLRGCAQNKDMSKEIVDKFFKALQSNNVDYISITFTGGEPTLNLPIINYTIEKLKQSDISLNRFYIATNGRANNDMEFIKTCIELYNLADEKEFSMVEVSSDIHHLCWMDDTFTGSLLAALRFASKRDEDVNYNDKHSGVIAEGFGVDFNNARELKVHDWKEYPEDLVLYLNCDGQLINGCDWSYKSQKEKEDIRLCTIDNFSEWLKEYNEVYEKQYA